MALVVKPLGTKWRPGRGAAGPYRAENLSMKKGLPPPTLLESKHHGRLESEGVLAEPSTRALKIFQENCLLFLLQKTNCI